MQRYFIEPEQLQGQTVTISGDDFHHLKRVMRAKVGQKIIVCLPTQQAYIVEITLITEDMITTKLVEPLVATVELPVDVTIIQGLPKGDKIEYIIQKATELGMVQLVPWAAKRAIVKLDAKKAVKKIERWQKIAKEAAEQSHRVVVPVISDLQTTNQVVASLADFDAVIIAFEETAKAGTHAMFKQIAQQLTPGQKVAIIIGPEGGLSEDEVGKFSEVGVAASFGPRILRTETASSYALSALSYELEL
ncbi:MAG: 16S rRNA (uracil(1498)-N(3))-methyltransferase [Culicoidibacterales bacterium]